MGYYQIKAAFPKPRARLKTDLEILNLIGESHEQYTIIKDQVDELITDTYSTRPLKLPKVKQREVRLLQAVFAILGSGSLLWTFYIVHDGWSWWGLLTGYFALGSFANVVVYPRMIRRREMRSKT